MIVLIDNYDSFTFNLVHFFGELGAPVRVHRNDKITSAAILTADPDAIVLSPGPCTPKEAGICLDLIAAVSDQIPIPVSYTHLDVYKRQVFRQVEIEEIRAHPNSAIAARLPGRGASFSRPTSRRPPPACG